jgi:hypothetical protein
MQEYDHLRHYSQRFTDGMLEIKFLLLTLSLKALGALALCVHRSVLWQLTSGTVSSKALVITSRKPEKQGLLDSLHINYKF